MKMSAHCCAYMCVHVRLHKSFILNQYFIDTDNSPSKEFIQFSWWKLRFSIYFRTNSIEQRLVWAKKSKYQYELRVKIVCTIYMTTVDTFMVPVPFALSVSRSLSLSHAVICLINPTKFNQLIFMHANMCRCVTDVHSLLICITENLPLSNYLLNFICMIVCEYMIAYWFIHNLISDLLR